MILHCYLSTLRSEIARWSALPTLLDTTARGRAPPEVLEAAEDIKRFLTT